MKKMRGVFGLAVAMLICLASVPAARADLKVLVVPARYSVLQVAFDVANRHGAVLVSYQGEVFSDSPILHYWNGAEWIRLSVDDYAQARFLQTMPETFILVGGPDMLPQVLASRVSSWCQDVRVIPSVTTPELINALGGAFSFSSHDWEWYAHRYNLKLEDRNEDRRRESWYDRTSYEDKWSDRWGWLKRKYNEPQPVETAAPEQAPQPAPRPYVEETVIEEVIVERWPAAPAEPPEESPAPIEVEETVLEEEVIEAYPVK